MEEKSVFKDLLDRYVKGSLTAAEQATFFAMMQDAEHQQELEQALDAAFEQVSGTEDEALGQKIYQRLDPAPTVHRIRWQRWAAAAAVLLLGGSGYFFLHHRAHPVTAAVVKTPADIAPGGNKAILTLANGQQVVLDKAKDGDLATQGTGTTIRKSGGQLAYSNDNAEAGDDLYNTITTPVGGQFKVVLPDGSAVWLNSCSSLRYPIAFRGNERRVTLTGEGYFEIKPAVAQPFKVTTEGLDVAVLGTRFNVMAYADEAAIRTTLVDGAVRLDKENEHVVLKPGQEGRADRQGGSITAQAGDVEDAIAWKNGLFSFENTDLKNIIRQMSRWYDLEIQFEGPLPKTHFSGTISRNGPLSGVLGVLGAMGVHFRLEGRKLVVMPVTP